MNLQAAILALDNYDNIEIVDSILTSQVTFSTYSPSAEKLANGTVLIHTYSHMTYDTDPLDFNNHISARWFSLIDTNYSVQTLTEP